MTRIVTPRHNRGGGGREGHPPPQLHPSLPRGIRRLVRGNGEEDPLTPSYLWGARKTLTSPNDVSSTKMTDFGGCLTHLAGLADDEGTLFFFGAPHPNRRSWSVIQRVERASAPRF